MPYQIVRERITTFHSKYEKYYAAWFFVGGFIFDVVTLDRIDNIYMIIQQAVYILLVGCILFYQTLEKTGHFRPAERTSWLGQKFLKAWHYNNEILHFVLGSLLSTYFLFYFVSSSIATSFLFLIVMFGLLVGNELPHVQEKGPWLKYIIYSICVFSFFSYIVPVILGFTNFFTLFVAILIGIAIAYLNFRAYQKRGVIEIDIKKNALYPPLSVATALLLLYFLKLLPPLPISIQYIGVYHAVEKHEDKYLLHYSRPWWKIWEYGAQTFDAQPGDKINCFVRIFSPNNFDDTVVFHWKKYGPNGWESRDRVPIRIVGGRAEGFRGYSAKGNFDPGDWRVQVETTDGREIGRIKFHVENVEPGPRDFDVDEY